MVLNKVKSATSNPGALAAAQNELGQRRFKFPREYNIFPYNAQAEGTTIGSLKT
jgi:hypothetical protein